jgi:hypothetical protein
VAVNTDGNGNTVSDLAAHKWEWDATNSNDNVDCEQDLDGADVGAYPDPDTNGGAVEDTFETLIETAAGELSTIASVAIPAASIIESILNAVDDTYDDDDRKRIEWQIGQNRNDVVAHQTYPGFVHEAGDATFWTVDEVADSLGNRIEFYGGDDGPTLSGFDKDPSYASISGVLGSDFSIGDFSNLLTSGLSGERSNRNKEKVIRPPGLEKDDFYPLPPTADMTAKEKQKYGVREPKESDKELFGRENAEINSVIEKYPISTVMKPIQL